jgi:hypothetical protein
MAEHEKPKVKVVLHNAIYTRVDDVDYGPGDTVEVPADHADGLVERGYAHREADAAKVEKDAEKADAEAAKVQGDAVHAAEVIEESKVRSAHEARVAQAQPAPVRRGRPPKNG